MQYIKLGRTDLEISRICIGSMGLDNPSCHQAAWAPHPVVSRPLIRHAIESGINFFEIADLLYSQESGEEALGAVLREYAKRESVVIATKLSVPTGATKSWGLLRKAIVLAVDQSLRRLGTDYIDLCQIHRVPSAASWEEILEVLHDLVKMGKVRHLGASSMTAREFSAALDLQGANGWARFVSMQIDYSLLSREEEAEMLPLCFDESIPVLASGPLARGRLVEPSREHELFEAVGAIAAERGVTRTQIALAWLYRNRVVAAPIVGVLRPGEIDDAIAALSIDLRDEEAAILEKAYTPPFNLPALWESASCARSPVSSGAKLAATDTACCVG